ncbi:Pre-rRNA-processing protein TSR2-domain-containing protein [Mycena amicta]|nr:Pre-rRNA-processing protein TSR2-domain-containing protein [Mycena amicta]
MATTSTPAVPPSTSVLFARGVIARLATWDTLRLAVQEGWGGGSGSAKRTWLASVIVDAFEETVPVPDDQYVEEILVQVLSDEFDTVLQDGSAEPVAVDIVRLWEETTAGRDELVLKYETKADGLKGKRAVAQELPGEDEEEWVSDEDDGEDDSDAMDEDEAPQLIEAQQEPRRREEPEIDEDGFTMVKGKGKSHR